MKNLILTTCPIFGVHHIKLYHSRDKYILNELDYQAVYKLLKNKYDVETPDKLNMARNFIDFSKALMIYYTLKCEKKDSKIYSAYVREGNRDRLDLLVLGYQTLEKVSERMRIDLFSCLAALRKWNFTFSFSQAEESNARKEFKDLTIEKHIHIIKTNLASVLNEDITKDQLHPSTPLFKAWHALQVVKLDYFLNLEQEKRVQLFTEKKDFQEFIEMVIGTLVLKNKVHCDVYGMLKKEFKERDVKVIDRISRLKGFPDKIFHHDLTEEFQGLKLTIQKIKKILSRQFKVSPTRSGSSEKYFSLTNKVHDYENFLMIEDLPLFEGNPFI